MDPLIKEASSIYERFVGDTIIVPASIPILFFGDSNRYFSSATKIITVGLNPSKEEFPRTGSFPNNSLVRFLDAQELYPAISNGRGYTSYLTALNNYFRNSPYRRWFRCYEPLLNSLDSSFYDGHANAVLHTDLCSPLATNPTWSGLGRAQKAALAAPGIGLWHRLVEYLAPDLIIISVARHHLTNVRFPEVGAWQNIYTISDRKDGTPRRGRYDIMARRVTIKKEHDSFIVFGAAANTPFGTVSNTDKEHLGKRIKELIDGK